MDILRGQLATIADQIIQRTRQFKKQGQQLNTQVKIDDELLNEDLQQYQEISKTFAQYKNFGNANINGILSDSQTSVLHHNYSYIFWIIIAIIIILITILVYSRVF